MEDLFDKNKKLVSYILFGFDKNSLKYHKYSI